MKEVKKRMAVHGIIAAKELLERLMQVCLVERKDKDEYQSAMQTVVKSVETTLGCLNAARGLIDGPLPSLKKIEKMFLDSGWDKLNHGYYVEYDTSVYGKTFKAKLLLQKNIDSEASRNAALLEFEAWKAFKKMLEDSKNDRP